MKRFTIELLQELKEQVNYDLPLGQELIDTRLVEYAQAYAGNHPYYKYLYHLTNLLEPALTVELGGWQGTSAACFAAGWPKGQVVTIDHLSDPGDDKNLVKMIEATVAYPNMRFFQGWTWDVVGQVKELNQPIDILFIDSWHQYEYAMRDWNDYSPFLASPALVICDDILGGDGPVIAGMRRFWDELPGEKWLDTDLHIGYPMGFIKYEH